MRSILLCLLVLFPLSCLTAQSLPSVRSSLKHRSNASSAGAPQPGDLYREFARHNGGSKDWRVTDKEAVRSFQRAANYLPNPILEVTIDDLEYAVRAEALLDRWGGHRGTINKRIRFNDGDWIIVPELDTVPLPLRAEQMFFQDNPVVEVPLEDLNEGVNTFTADCDEEGGFGWGQWGLYSMVVRVYYDREAKGAARALNAKITHPVSSSVIGDDPVIEVAAEAAMGVARVDVLAAYDGYDEDGDGHYDGFHESRFQLVSGQPNEVRDHVGTIWSKPYRLTWGTHWVPDQRPRGVQLIARVQDSRGYWTVSEPVTDLTLAREDVSVKLYRARDVPEDFGVRVDKTKSCFFDIPAVDPIANATEAILHLRTWHGWDGHHDPIRINDHAMSVDGKNHFYDYDKLEFPPAALRTGTNTFTIHSPTEHHMLEVLWPGPAIAVRMPIADALPADECQNAESQAGSLPADAAQTEGERQVSAAENLTVSIDEGSYEGRDHFVVRTPSATYWLDRGSGGLSRLIDRDGNDWIAFKMKPWGDYPAAAAGAFRGIPNLLFGVAEGGFGHPGHDRATSEKVGNSTIVATSHSGTWKLIWDFGPDDVHLRVRTSDRETKYWFLYEGPIAGRFAPHQQYFAADTRPPTDRPRDYYKGEKWFEHYRWVYFGDKRVERVLYFVHEQPDQAIDTFAHLGSTQDGLDSEDGMVVFGFGRGPNGIDPLLQGDQSFRLGLLEQRGDTKMLFRAIADRLSP